MRWFVTSVLPVGGAPPTQKMRERETKCIWRARDEAEAPMIIACEFGHAPPSLADLADVVLRGDCVLNGDGDAAVAAYDLLERVIVVSRQKRNVGPRLAAAKTAFLRALAALRVARPSQPAPPLARRMPVRQRGADAERDTLIAQVARHVDTARVPLRKLGTIDEWRDELTAQTLAECIAPGPKVWKENNPTRAFERAKKQLAKIHREVGFVVGEGENEQIIFRSVAKTG